MPLKLIKRGEIWYLRGTVAGRRVYESTRIGDKRAAEIIRARREAEIIERTSLGRKGTTTFAQAAATYLAAGGEARYLEKIIRHFGPRYRLADVDNDAANEAAQKLYPDAAPATINRQVITPISAVVNLAAEDGKCEHRRFRRRKEPQGRIRWLTPEEGERLILAADKRTRLMILFLLGTGCRVSEALDLNVADLHLATGEAWIGRTKNQEPRMVPLPSRLRRALAFADLPKVGVVFRTPKGEPYKLATGSGGQIQTAFNEARAAAGLGTDVSPHTCRHSWATWYYAATKDFGGLMDFGGWKKADMANRYRKIAPADVGARLHKLGWDFGETGSKPVQEVVTERAENDRSA